MTNDSFFAMMCVSIIGLFFGFVLAFSGYRFFLFLLPIWGFFFGFGLGAQTIQAIFGTGFLSDVTSWIVGFIVALVFAVLSYLFYIVAVALFAGSIGYTIGAGIVLAILPSFNITAWIVGIVAGVILAAVVVLLNVQKYVVMAGTAWLGAGIILGVFLFIFGGLPSSELVANPVKAAISGNWLLMILFIAVFIFGFLSQWTTGQRGKWKATIAWKK